MPPVSNRTAMYCPTKEISLLKSPWKKAGLDPAEARLLLSPSSWWPRSLRTGAILGATPKPALQQDHTPVSQLTSWRLHFPEVFILQ